MMGSPHISEPDKIVEIADQRAPLARRPQHPYTEAPWSAMPVPDPEAAQQRIILKGATMNIFRRLTPSIWRIFGLRKP